MMASTSRPVDVDSRSSSPASRRSISSQAASASRALSNIATSTVSTPYAGLTSSASSSSSMSSPRRRSLASAGRNSFSRYSASSPSSDSPAKEFATYRSRRSGSSSSSNNLDENATASTSRRVSGPTRRIDDSTTAKSPYSATPTATTQRPHFQRQTSVQSVQTLRLDLDGLDLGGNQANLPTIDDASVDQRHVRSRSNTTDQPSFTASKQQPLGVPTYNGLDADMDRFCFSCADEGRSHEPLNGMEDSFSVHLRAECSDYRQIMSSQVVLNAAADKEQRLRNASLDSLEAQRQRGYSISHGQVLGGFASLGLQTEADDGPLAPAPARQQPMRTITKGSSDSSEAPATPIEWRDSFGTLCAPAEATPPPKWACLTSRPCNPLEPLDVLSVQEMGIHSLDMGSLNDWEGCKLSAEILCPINGHQHIEWSVAQTTRRNKKWVVVPNATITCGETMPLSSSAQAERTVIVSGRSLWLDGSDANVAQRDPAQSASLAQSMQRRSGLAFSGPSSRSASSGPFSGKAGFELRILRPTTGKICPPLYLANASTHRYLHQFRKENSPRSVSPANGLFSSAASTMQPVYPALRRSRSRPYLRPSHAPLRRSRSKPYLKHSDAQQQAASEAASPRRGNPEEFAPSLPGDPLVRTAPGESWPSARTRHSDSLSSFNSVTSSDLDSDTSSDEADFSVTNTHESVVGSVSSASYDQAAKRGDQNDGQRARSAAIPMAVTGSRAGRGLRSMSPGSSASRNLSSPSEWQQGSIEHQREADSWQGTSPTTASSMSASSKQSRGRKGIQRALQKKDKMLNSWFKRRPDNTTSPVESPVNERDLTQGLPSLAGVVQPAQASSATSSSTRSSLAHEQQEDASAGVVTGSTPLTETALESFQKAMFRPASPESTIMGSRRGSEALTQKAVEAGNGAADRSAQDKTATSSKGFESSGISQQRSGGFENRAAVNSELSRVYGWGPEQASDKFLRPVARMGEGSALPGSSFQDLDESNALLGIDPVPAGALTMLIPLPLIGRDAAQDAVRYMRVNFVPFGDFADSFESSQGPAGGAAAALQNAGSPGAESESAIPQSLSTGSGSFASHREAATASGTAAKSSEQSSWKRKLGLSSSHSRNGNVGNAGQLNGVHGVNASNMRFESGAATADMPHSPPAASNEPAAFRITAVVHDAPWMSTARQPRNVDPRLPEAGTFPVVLGYCNGTKALEMVPEGWGALRLAGVPEPTKPDGSPLDGMHPLNGVTDVIIAACTAVMDV